MPMGTLVKPFSGPSITNISVPVTNTSTATTLRNTKILRALACSARPSIRYSSGKPRSAGKIWKVRTSRSARTAARYCASGKKIAR
ncbi:hypothetical protein D3C85_1594690 [compost metagenome]